MKTILYYPISNNQIVETDSVETKVQKCGKNTGNVVWAEAVKKNICFDYLWDIRNISDEGIVDDINILLPMANDINIESSTLEFYKEHLLKNPKVKVSILGLGAQLTKELNTPKKLVNALPEKKKTALKEFSERTELIGVRGYITAECLDELGIHNYIVIGCPSFYSYGSNLPVYQNSSSDKICFNWSGSSKDSSFKRQIMLKGGLGSCLMMQGMEDFPKTLFENTMILDRHVDKIFHRSNILPEELFHYIKRVGHIYFNAAEWRKYLQQEGFTMAVGCRFHGNMMAWLCGIPALWIVHDSRTIELTEVLKLPAISLEKANNINELKELEEYCNYGKEFYLNYDKMYQSYMKCLVVNGLKQRDIDV